VPAPHVVVRPYLAPATQYGPGHRGIDLRAPVGTPVAAPDDGTVLFAGRVVDRGVLSIDHGTVRSSVEPVRALVHPGEHVARGQVVAILAAPGATHPAGVLHLGARVRDGYVSPLLFLGGLRRAVLLPLVPPP
jgi:murein DD-endopeptidase MepM/ murein hydrolase activator NlpD